VPYEKGFNFIIFIKNILKDNEFFRKLLQNYIKKFRTTSISYVEFKDHYITEVKTQYGDKADDILKQIDWDAWVLNPGQLPKQNNFSKNN
jgi:hypothetical protein